jgi:glycosyltransferase involved in cell wall biosynthesis
MKVLYLSFDGMTDALGRSQVIPYIKGLASKGYSITLISLEKKDRLNHDFDKVNKMLEESDIIWYPLVYSTAIPILSPYYNLFKLKRRALQVFSKNPFQIIHCRSYLTSLIGLWFKKKKGIHFIFDMRGLWADERIDGKIWSLKNPVYKCIYNYFKRKEIEFLEYADATICLTNKVKEEILSWDSTRKNILIGVIPCCADLDLFNPKSLDESKLKNIKNELQISDKDMIISYLGNVGTWYQLDEMLIFVKKLMGSDNDVKFLMISQEQHEYIWSKINEHRIDKEKVCVISADRTQVPYYIQLSNYSLFFIKRCYSKIASSPTKLGEILSMGVPVICNSGIGDVDAIINENNCGYLLNNYEENEMKTVISEIKLKKAFDKHSIRQIANKYFSLENGVQKYFEVYKKIERKSTY